MKTIKSTRKAVKFLNKVKRMYTPDAIKEILHLTCSHASIGRSLRRMARRGEVSRSYYINKNGVEIAVYGRIK